MKTHYTIPIFIPESACPFRCTYCNQYNITQKATSPTPDEVVSVIQQYLATIPPNNPDIEIKAAFFGGSFTGLPISEQQRYLEVVSPFIESRQVDSVQLSTRPDYINQEILDLLKLHHVKLIELGAQSLDPQVLQLTRRGHTVEDVEKSSHLILQNGFELGLQMMVGLLGDSKEKSFETAQKIVSLKAHYTRIYPTLVIKDTDLETAYFKGEYTPLTLDQAIDWVAPLFTLFENHQVQILRIGLHPSEGFINRDTLVAGPFHVSFKELVLTEIWKEKLLKLSENNHSDTFIIEVPKSEINYAIGYQSKNRKMLEQRFQKVIFKQLSN